MKIKSLKLNDIIGAGCGVFLVLVLVVSIIVNAMPVTAGVKDREVPAEAVAMTGTARGILLKRAGETRGLRFYDVFQSAWRICGSI